MGPTQLLPRRRLATMTSILPPPPTVSTVYSYVPLQEEEEAAAAARVVAFCGPSRVRNFVIFMSLHRRPPAIPTNRKISFSKDRHDPQNNLFLQSISGNEF
ncbi:hypothetical protein D8674_037092 [Pyrus ussuriensis x Pyrus communis]|uniref:Uncharacterized protein n=1 Tax=Pyrus ussuriensis x Pyrus communis TaxID=2448454 RepID=A0A5N5H215_9ROSA|nr:hypothetical protein D8674_037092 [Pyrus ussuriensis x Pyrus communis]